MREQEAGAIWPLLFWLLKEKIISLPQLTGCKGNGPNF